MQNIVVTGATSMIGIALVNECVNNDIHVTAIIRKDSKKRKLLPESKLIDIIECDLGEIKNASITLKQKPDAFYHLAWEGTGSNDRNNIELQNRNIDHTLYALRLAHGFNCKKFIGAGSQAEYGRVSGRITPDMNVSPDNAYGVAKYAAGKFSSLLAEQLGIDFIWTRVFSVYGANDLQSTMVMSCVDSLLRGEKPVLTKCEQKWDYLHCEDAAKAFFLLGTKGKNQVLYHIACGKTQPLVDYVKMIRNTIDPTLPLGIGEKPYAKGQVMELCPDISSLQKDTGFSPSVTFSEGIKKTIQWYKENILS